MELDRNSMLDVEAKRNADHESLCVHPNSIFISNPYLNGSNIFQRVRSQLKWDIAPILLRERF